MQSSRKCSSYNEFSSSCQSSSTNSRTFNGPASNLRTGESSAPHQHRIAAGIDLGTTNSLVASIRSGEAACLPDADGSKLLASVVHYDDTQVLVGNAAQALQADDR